MKLTRTENDVMLKVSFSSFVDRSFSSNWLSEGCVVFSIKCIDIPHDFYSENAVRQNINTVKGLVLERTRVPGTENWHHIKHVNVHTRATFYLLWLYVYEIKVDLFTMFHEILINVFTKMKALCKFKTTPWLLGHFEYQWCLRGCGLFTRKWKWS